MKKILNIISSPRKEHSFSIKLSNAVVEQLLAAHEDSTVQTHDLTNSPFPHLEESHLTSFFTPPDQRTPKHLEAVRHSDDAIKLIMEADMIVIGVPMYNFGIASTLKAWLDHILRAGITFRYSEQGVEGLVRDKKVYLCIATGGVYSDGPMKSYDFTEPYLRTVLGFAGMTDITVFRVEGVDARGKGNCA
jgi:FMN-dependent NADH-azoreductase